MRNGTPEHILNLPADEREAYRALRNAGARSTLTPKSDKVIAAQLGWRLARYTAAMDALARRGYVRGTPEARHVRE